VTRRYPAYGFTIFVDGLPDELIYAEDTTQAKIPFDVSAEVEITDACGTTVVDTVSTLFIP
jgi:hypothetical protein